MTRNDYIAVAQKIRSSKRILVVSHYNPDGDALGSSIALTLAIRELGISADCYNESDISSRYHFFPFAKEILSTLQEDQYDAVIVCDCGDLARMGDATVKQLSSHQCLINIDHHISNSSFGNLNIVEVNKSSTAEIIFGLIKELAVRLTPDIATSLFAGILTDTGSFRYPCTGVETFTVAAELLASGARTQEVVNEIYERRSRSSLLLCSHALTNIKFHADGRIAEVFVPQELYKQCGATSDDTEGLVEEARSVDGVVVSVLMREEQDMWRVSLRSSDPENADVSHVAAYFGGGGHKAAAAFRWKRDIALLKPELLSKLKDLFKT